MKKYLYLIVFVMIFVKINTANSQTFPDINNDTTYLRKITFKEGATEDMPIYFDTTGLNGFQLKHLLGGYKER